MTAKISMYFTSQCLPIVVKSMTVKYILVCYSSISMELVLQNSAFFALSFLGSLDSLEPSKQSGMCSDSFVILFFALIDYSNSTHSNVVRRNCNISIRIRPYTVYRMAWNLSYRQFFFAIL